ncbi:MULTISPECIES: ATP synthase F0 subunit A [Aerococcus]|uniref:ATP synthase F0 subunit A n=1 Tax=Aerococcus urinae (strain CCUG 59500 / ACS-120-V-Col10a) TaxID=2976812 RepID=UPI000200E4F2|nr:ATP synthase F0 subunit A [Aerococcus sp. Group 1]AEA00361.1 putative ATP synthase F0, A subunit [Aerococcus sp. Group 1]MCY3030580.1 hypothetical protein [Aerococcus sp. Group 1]MCY3055581.1 hypothetical protein [Aerococcus sp. Group 1]MCY3057311.1 hypothetical protein [Aerococcus sp. Group 1]MCY3061264.1 hypothetical protein [Aerococcus sp. Group 1]
MLNFMRFDLKKMFKSPAFYIGFIFIFALGIFGTHVSQQSGYGQPYELYRETQEKRQAENEEKQARERSDDQAGLEISPAPSPTLDEETYQALQEEHYANYKLDRACWGFMVNMTKYSWVFFALFLGLDFFSGYLKNLLPLEKARQSWLFSKLGLALTYGLISLWLGLVFGTLTTFMSGQDFTGLDFISLAKHFVLIECLLVFIMALTSTIILLSQSRTVSVVFAILISLGLLASLLGALSNLVDLSLGEWIYSIRYQSLDFKETEPILPLLCLAFSQILLVSAFNNYRIQKMDFHFGY